MIVQVIDSCTGEAYWVRDGIMPGTLFNLNLPWLPYVRYQTIQRIGQDPLEVTPNRIGRWFRCDDKGNPLNAEEFEQASVQLEAGERILLDARIGCATKGE